jgi:hypothetical protein
MEIDLVDAVAETVMGPELGHGAIGDAGEVLRLGRGHEFADRFEIGAKSARHIGRDVLQQRIGTVGIVPGKGGALIVGLGGQRLGSGSSDLAYRDSQGFAWGHRAFPALASLPLPRNLSIDRTTAPRIQIGSAKDVVAHASDLNPTGHMMSFPHRHLLGIKGLSEPDIHYLLDQADEAVKISRQREKLRGLTQINLFFESSTRTQASFELAGKRLGADVMNMSVASSSVKKGETLIDTAMTLNAMHPDCWWCAIRCPGAVALLAEKVNCAGDQRRRRRA